MATTINTSADLIALLRNNKEFREEVRRFVLTDEMFALPDVIRSIDARLGALEETQQRMSALLEHVVDRQDQMAARQDRMESRLDALEASHAKLLETQQQMAALLEQVMARQDRTDERLEALEASHAKMLETQQRMSALLEHVVARQDRTDERLDRLDKRVDGLDAKVNALDTKVDALTRRVTNVEAIVRGEAFERRMYSRLLPRLPMEYDITRVHAVSVDPQASVRVPDFRARDFENNIEALRSRGAITDDDVDNINNTDMVVQSLRRSDRSRLWFAVQATVTIRDDAITRAHAGAESLRKAFGQDVIALTYGRRIADQQRRLADELGVVTLIDSWEREDYDAEEPPQ